MVSISNETTIPVSRLVILGRDGVINRDLGRPVTHPDVWEPLPGSLEAIARLTQAGLRVAIATNQPGLASGELDLDHLNAVHRKLHDALDRLGGQVAAIACCPHGADAGCDCRKPAPGMYQQLAERFGVTYGEMVVIGHDTDMRAAADLGAFGMHLAGPGDQHDNGARFDNLAHAVSALLLEE